MPYGSIKVDNIVFTNGGSDQTITVSGLIASTSGNLTVTGTVQGGTIIGTSTISGATITGNTGQFTTLTGGTAGFTTVTGTTVTGTTANFASGVFTTQISGATVTGNVGSFATITGGVVTLTSGVFAAGSASAPSISFSSDSNTGIYSPGADQVAISANGTGRLFVASNGSVGVGTSVPDQLLHVNGNAVVGGSPAARYSNFTVAGTAGIQSATPLLNLVNAAGSTRFGYIYHNGAGGNIDILNQENGGLTFGTNNTERLRITSGGLVGIGTSSPSDLLSLSGSGTILGFASGPVVSLADASNRTLKIAGPGAVTNAVIGTTTSHDLQFITGNTIRATVDTSGRLGIGTTSPSNQLTVGANGTSTITLDWTGDNLPKATFSANHATGEVRIGATNNTGTYFTTLYSNNNEAVRIDSSRRLLVGTSSALGTNCSVAIKGTAANNAAIYLGRSANAAGIVANETLGFLEFGSGDGGLGAEIRAAADGTWSSTSDCPSRLTFSTTADGASSPTERMRITNGGTVAVGVTSPTFSFSDNPGVQLSSGRVLASADGSASLFINRKTSDGDLVVFAQADTQEGSISVSGTTVSYNGAHLSRWSQLPSGADRIEILRGSVLSNIDEMCEWGDEDNEQLNRMKVSDVEGDKNVSGVFQAWDDDDDTYTNDFYCAMTGDFIIRIAEGVTVERGDLLMSAGDGTAKPQDDDIIRSKTIAKVTSTNVSCTYGDGSYCVPCVLMAC